MSRALSFGNVLGWALLLVLIAFYGAIGTYAPYLVLLLTLIAIPYTVAQRAGRPLVPDLPALGFLVALGLLTLAFSLSAHQPSDVLIIANFAWLLLFIPIQSLLKRMAGPPAPVIVARLALLGVTLILALAVYERTALDVTRVGALTSDPIRIANSAVIFGFLGLVGVMADRGRLKLVYFAGPLLALGVAYLAGTRGAMVASLVIGVLAAIMLVPRRGIALLVALGVAVVAVAALLIAAQLHVPRVDTLVQTIEQIFTGQGVTDASAHIRLSMQRTAIAAFLDSPWFGHGWQRIIDAAVVYLPPGEEHLFDGQPHLHNDIANFAVAGGVLGLLGYLTILLTPLVAALRSARDSLYRIRLFGIVVLTVSYAALGLNSLMFGFEVHTALFCGLSAVLLGFCRETSSVEQEAAMPVAPLSPRRRGIEQVTAWVLLLLALVVSTTVGLITPYIIVVIGLVTWFTLLFTGRLPETYRPLAGRLFLIAFAILLVEFALTAQAVRDIIYTFNFTMFALFGPLAWLMARANGARSMERVVVMAAAGVGITLLMILYFDLSGIERPKGINLGPIVLSNAALALAVVATMGTVALRTRWSLLLPLTIVAAVAITVLTQSRGPLLAVPALLVFTIGFIWLTRFRRNWLFPVAAVAAVVAVVLIAVFAARERVADLPHILDAVLGGNATDDHTTNIRLALYAAGWQSFLQSPWLGHGWVRLMSSSLPFLAPAYLPDVQDLRHLHNDVLDFAVAGGVVGIGVYALVIVTPLLAALTAPRDRYWPARVYGTGGIAIVYLGAGLTDLMFGHEFHTALYVMLNAVILSLREPAKTGP